MLDLAVYYYLWLLARGYNIPATTVFIFLIFIAHCDNAFQGSRCIMKNCKATYILFNKIPRCAVLDICTLYAELS